MQIEASTVEIEERGVKLRLTVVDTPGYGDAINSQDWCVYNDGRSSYSSCALAPISCCVGSLPPLLPLSALFPFDCTDIPVFGTVGLIYNSGLVTTSSDLRARLSAIEQVSSSIDSSQWCW